MSGKRQISGNWRISGILGTVGIESAPASGRYQHDKAPDQGIPHEPWTSLHPVQTPPGLTPGAGNAITW
jgi:hypothetical protein